MTEEELNRSAVGGTESILKACLDFGVKKCVITSSMATILGTDNYHKEFKEEHYSSVNEKYMLPYYKSKILATRCVREFIKNLPKNSGLEIVSVLPGLITGTPLFFVKLKKTNLRPNFVQIKENIFVSRFDQRFYDWQST